MNFKLHILHLFCVIGDDFEDITVFRGTFKFDNFYFDYHIEANQENFLRFLASNSAPPNVHLGTVYTDSSTDSNCYPPLVRTYICPLHYGKTGIWICIPIYSV